MNHLAINPPSITLTGLQLIDLDKIDKATDQLALRPLDLKRVETIMKMMVESRIPPITVRAGEGGRYGVVDGNHRLFAARQLKLPEINAVVVDCDEQDAVGFAIASNTNRKDLTGPQLAAAAKALQNAGSGALRPGLRQLAKALGTSHTRLKRTIKVSKKLNPECRAAYEAEQISEDGANDLSKLLPEAQTAMLDDAKKVKAGLLKRDVFRARIADRRRRDLNLPESTAVSALGRDGEPAQPPTRDRNPCWKVVDFEQGLSAADLLKLGADERRDLVDAATAAAASVSRLLQLLTTPEVSTAGGGQ